MIYHNTDTTPLYYKEDLLKEAGFDNLPRTNEELVE